MATAGVIVDTRMDTGDMECVLCTERYRDPRLLLCGHHFCIVCLEKVVKVGSLTCPTCRYVTQVGDVTELPRYKKTNQFSENVAGVTQKQNQVEKQCEVCEKKTGATKTCMKCRVILCPQCACAHGGIETELGHKAHPISTHMFCTDHQDKCVVFHCLTCSHTVCPPCAIGKHSDHNLEDIDTAGEKARKRLLDVRNEMDNNTSEETARNALKRTLEKANEIQTSFKLSINELKSSLAALAAKVDKVSEEVNAKLDADIKLLEMMSTDMSDYMESKASLRDHITYLTEAASSPEVVAREKELPKYDRNTYKQVISKQVIELPELGSTLSDVRAQVDRYQKDLDIMYTKHNLDSPYTVHGKPLQDLKKVTTIHAGDTTYGLAVDSKRERLIVRRRDNTAPITVYDFQGQQLQVLGTGVTGICDGSYRSQSVAIDTKRDVYILPTSHGSLVTMDMTGMVKDTITVTNADLQGVCYTDQDICVTSSASTTPHMVYLVNPVNKQTMATLAPNPPFNRPLYVSSGQFISGTDTNPEVIVSDRRNHCIKVLDYDGRPLHTYGKEGNKGQGEGQLSGPFGVCTDPGGRIIVCDWSNNRVVSFWSEGDKDKCETLLDKVTLGGKNYPRCTVCDLVSRRLFVGYDDGTILVFKG